MIPQAAIIEWRREALWSADFWVEQDLIISRALVEHFTALGLVRVPFEVESQWFREQADATTFALDELLGTKLRALYQRRKGRDLFDLWFALEQKVVNSGALLDCFDRYMTEGGHAVTRALFEANLHEKAGRRDFRDDIGPLLRPGMAWDFDGALKVVSDQLIARLPGDPWKRGGE